MAENPTKAQEVAQTCYRMAYFILPPYVYNQPDKIVQELQSGPMGAMFFYALTCSVIGKEPEKEALAQFAAHTGTLDEEHDFYIIEYPTPPSVNLMDDDAEAMIAQMQNIVLAPYFSAMIRTRTDGSVRYFILGQSPDGHTTFRSVTPDINANLGRGCEPRLDAFVALLRERLPTTEAPPEKKPGRKWW